MYELHLIKEIKCGHILNLSYITSLSKRKLARARHDICTTLRHNVGNQIEGKWQQTGSTAHNITNQSDEIKCQ